MEHAVFVHLEMTGSWFKKRRERQAMAALGERLEVAVNASGVGEFDGDEYGNGECVFYMYGPDAERLFATVEPILREAIVARGGYAIKRFGDVGDADAHMERVAL